MAPPPTRENAFKPHVGQSQPLYPLVGVLYGVGPVRGCMELLEGCNGVCAGCRWAVWGWGEEGARVLAQVGVLWE